MENFTYLLSYAGIPFIGDRASTPAHEIPPSDAPVPTERWLPRREFYDELCSLIPLESLREFYPPSCFQGRNLAALDGEDRQFDGKVEVGCWFYPTGATRWSVFHGLVMSSMAKEMVSLTNGGSLPGTFTLQAQASTPLNLYNTSYKNTSLMYLLPPRCISENYGEEGVYLVTLVDARYYWQGTSITLHPSINTTWDDVITSLASALDITISYSPIESVYNRPERDSQLWVNSESASFLLDVVAHNLGRVLVRNLDNTYSLMSWSESQTQVNLNRGSSLRVVRYAGSDIFNSGSRLKAGSLVKARNSIVPSRVNITFPYYVNDNNPVPHYLNSRYAPDRPTTWYEQSYGSVYSVSVPISSGGDNVSGLVGVSDHYIHNTAKALISGEVQTTPINSSGLISLALQLAKNHYDSQVVPTLDETYPGTLIWTPEGCHDIHWTYSERLRRASTRVVRAEWNLGYREMQHGTPVPAGMLSGVVGVGGPSVAQTVRDLASGVSYGTNLITFGPGFTVGNTYTSGGISQALVEYNPCCDECDCIEGMEITGNALPWIASGDWTALDISGQAGVVSIQSGLLSVGSLAGITSGAISSGLLASGTVQGFFGATRHIASGTVGVFDLGSGAILSGNIASGQVGHHHIANTAIRSGQLAATNQQAVFGTGSGSTYTSTIRQFTIGYGELTNDCVVGSRIGGLSLTNGNIASGTIDTQDLADLSITSGKLVSGSITYWNISSGSIICQSGISISINTNGQLVIGRIT